MKTLLITACVAVLVLLAVFCVLAYRSQSGEPTGLAEGRLARCPESPNCVCSEYQDERAHYVAPWPLGKRDSRQALDDLEAAIRTAGGVVLARRDDYLSATFSSRIFRFVDDFEARVDIAQGRIHLRSASRVGNSDFGANRARVERLAGLAGFRGR